ncbi:MAG: PEP-CTERM sorting domain-containing protein [Armatimonadota bacterium]
MRLRQRNVHSGALKCCSAATLVAALLLSVSFCAEADVVLDNMPRYNWWGGCAPTSGGMIVGYWDAAGYPLYAGDASIWNDADAAYSSDEADGLPAGTAAMVSSWNHINDGDDGYNSSVGCGRFLEGTREEDFIADFMAADNGDVQYASDVSGGLVDFAEWDDPRTADFDESVLASSSVYLTLVSPDPWTVLVAEIDAGRPVIAMLRDSGEGHAVAAYGHRSVDGTKYMAVHDTWNDGLSWAPPGSEIIEGVEWWTWNPTWSSGTSTGLDLTGAGPINEITYASRDWTVDSLVTFDPTPAGPNDPIPEPGTAAMLLLGLGVAALRRRAAAPSSSDN